MKQFAFFFRFHRQTSTDRGSVADQALLAHHDQVRDARRHDGRLRHHRRYESSSMDPVFTGFPLQFQLAFTGFHSISFGDVLAFYRVSMGFFFFVFMGFYWVILGCFGFGWLILDFTGF